MKCFLSKLLTLAVGFGIFLAGLWFIKEGLVISGALLIGFGCFVVAMVECIHDTSTQKYELKEKHVEEIVAECQKVALMQEVDFIEAEHAEEIIDLVDSWDFEDAMVASYAIQAKFPTLKQGREICL